MNHYIYAHLEKGEPVYIGIGEHSRAWISHTREPEHKAWMQSILPEIEIQFIATNLSKQHAINLESILINELKPKFNNRPGRKVFDGNKWWSSAWQAANMHGITVTAATTRCNQGFYGWRYSDNQETL